MAACRTIGRTAALLVLSACAGEAAERARSASSVENAVRLELEAYYRDLSARDWEAFADHFWPGASLTTVWQPPGEASPRVVPTSVADFVKQAPQGPGSREIFEERMLTAEVQVEGDLAQAWVRYRARFGDPGDIDEWEGVDAISLLRFEGRWKIASLAFVPVD